MLAHDVILYFILAAIFFFRTTEIGKREANIDFLKSIPNALRRL